MHSIWRQLGTPPAAARRACRLHLGGGRRNRGIPTTTTSVRNDVALSNSGQGFPVGPPGTIIVNRLEVPIQDWHPERCPRQPHQADEPLATMATAQPHGLVQHEPRPPRKWPSISKWRTPHDGQNPHPVPRGGSRVDPHCSPRGTSDGVSRLRPTRTDPSTYSRQRTSHLLAAVPTARSGASVFRLLSRARRCFCAFGGLPPNRARQSPTTTSMPMPVPSSFRSTGRRLS